MKCPLNGLCECDPECAIRITATNVDMDGGKIVVGEVCGIASISCNREVETFVPRFVDVICREVIDGSEESEQRALDSIEVRVKERYGVKDEDASN